ncbi:hypothetical protein AHAS_Ahas13G0151700 [Arachis hypogaea]
MSLGGNEHCKKKDYSIFSDVLTFDVMYGHNKYNLPIAVFSGVNHHCVFGTAMVSNESQESYIWVLQKVLECMQVKTPKAIIIDGDPVMRVAIQDVFPDAHHRLCAWHLLRNATPIFINHDSHSCLDYARWLIQRLVSLSIGRMPWWKSVG